MFVFFFHKDGSNYSCCGKHDNDLQGRHSHTAGEQKFVNLFDIMLSSFCGKGHYVTCDSTYMGDIMALIATIQANRTGVQMAASVNRPQSIKKKTYEYKMWQHNTQSSVAAVWSDNNLVKTLSNYHQPQIIPAGMMRRKIGDNGIREKDATPVNAPMQNVNYSDTYCQIDKSNQIEAQYVLVKQGSKKHG